MKNAKLSLLLAGAALAQLGALGMTGAVLTMRPSGEESSLALVTGMLWGLAFLFWMIYANEKT